MISRQFESFEKAVAVAAVFSLPFVFFPGIANPWALPKTFFLLFCSATILASRWLRRFGFRSEPLSGSAENGSEFHLSRWFVAPISAFLFSSAVSAVSSTDPVTAWFGSADRGMGYSAILAGVAFAYAAATSPASSKSLAKAFVLWSALLAAVALAVKAWESSETLWELGFDGRMAVTIGQYNVFGAYLATASAVAAAVFVSGALPRPTGLRDCAGTPSAILPYAVLQALFLAGTAVSGSRAAIIISAVSIAAGLVPWIRTRFSPSVLWAAVAVSAISLSFATLSLAGRASVDAANAASVSSRALIMKDAWNAVFGFGPNPSGTGFSVFELFFGRGPDSQLSVLLPQYSAKYFEFENLDAVPDRVHFVPADAFLQFGAIGATLLVSLIFVIPLALAIFPRFANSIPSPSQGRRPDEKDFARLCAFVAVASFVVSSVGFYDVSTLAASLLFCSLATRIPADPDALSRFPKPQPQRILRCVSLPFVLSVSCLISAVFVIPGIVEQRRFVELQSVSDPDPSTLRDSALAARIFAPRLTDVSTQGVPEPFSGTDRGFRNLCERNNYFALEVCVRYLAIWNAERPESSVSTTLDSAVARLLAIAPSDPTGREIRLERLIERGDPSVPREAAELLGTFPSFVTADENSLNPYQLRKKTLIAERFPISDWIRLSLER